MRTLRIETKPATLFTSAALWENIPSDMCAKRRLPLNCASAQCICCPHEETLHSWLSKCAPFLDIAAHIFNSTIEADTQRWNNVEFNVDSRCWCQITLRVAVSAGNVAATSIKFVAAKSTLNRRCFNVVYQHWNNVDSALN